MTSCKPNFLPQALFSNTITLEVKALTHEFWRDTIQSTGGSNPNLNTEESAALRGVVRRELRKICHTENECYTKEPLGVPSRQCSGENYV